MSNIKRNDPCHCGSGEKYKKCHMAADKAAEREQRSWKEAAKFLRTDLLRFARDERFALDFAKGLPIFWDGLYDASTADEMSQDEAVRFMDWFLYDYDWTDEEGNTSRLIELYRTEKEEELTQAQVETLDGWLTAGAFGAYTLLDYDGQSLTVSEFMTGEEFTVYESGGRGQVEIGEILLVRLIPVRGHIEFSTSAAYLPADEITDLAGKLEAAKENYMAEHPDADHDDFMRHNNTILVYHALEQAKVQGRAQVARLDADREDKKMQQRVVRKVQRLRH